MKRVKARGLRSKHCTRDCRPSWSPVPAMDSLSLPRTAMETLHPKTRAQPSPLATMLDRSVYFSLFKLWIRIRVQKQPADSSRTCRFYFARSAWNQMDRMDECAFMFSSRFLTTSQGLSAETRTPSLRILFLRWSVSTQWKRAHEHIVASEHIWCTRFHTRHTKALCVKESLFLYLCVFHHTPQTAQAVCSSSIDVARCGVISLAAHRQALCGRQALLTSSSLIAVIPAMELIF